jgi:hypothetical protein
MIAIKHPNFRHSLSSRIPEPLESKMWSWGLRDSEPRMTVLTDCVIDWLTEWMTDWLLNWCRSLPALFFLVPSSTEIMTIFYSLMALGFFRGPALNVLARVSSNLSVTVTIIRCSLVTIITTKHQTSGTCRPYHHISVRILLFSPFQSFSNKKLVGK